MTRLTAAAYYAGIPARNSNPEKPQILDNFLAGVKVCGDTGIAHKGTNIVDADVALIQGFVHEHGKKASHLQVRRNAIDYQQQQGKKALIVDSNLFLFKDPTNRKRYLRYSFNGVFPSTGFYFDSEYTADRWNQIQSDLNVNLKPWREHGDHILLCLQRNGGWSMRGLDVMEWMNKTILDIRNYDKHRPIVVRTHPGDKKIKSYLRINYKNVRLSSNRDIVEDLKGAWATVIYNSSPGVASALEGIPVIITDPKLGYSQAESVSNLGIDKIKNPIKPDREQWIQKLCMSHWNFEELKDGRAWSFFRKYV